MCLPSIAGCHGDAAAAALLDRRRRVLSGTDFHPRWVGRFYVTPTGDDPALLRQLHNLDAQADLAAHEGFPGHDWNYKVMTEYRAVISPIRWLTPGAVEDSSSMWKIRFPPRAGRCIRKA